MKKNKRNNKKKLSSLILLLLMTTVMLVTSTYAWFTANKTVTINSIDVNVATSSGLQISADATVWKTAIAKADLVNVANWDGNKNQMPDILKPVSTTNNLNSNKLFDFYTGVVKSNATGDFILTSELINEAKGTTGDYVAFDIFLRTDKEGPIYLTKAASVVATASHDDNGLKNASRVGFVQQGNDTADKSPQQLQALANQANINSGTKQVIWEPNFDVHTTYGIAQAQTYYGQTPQATGAAKIAYDGVKAPINDTDGGGTGITLSKATAAQNSEKFEAVTTVETKATPDAYKEIFQLQKGVTKIRVYLWVEGQDVDCENNASGGYISYNIILSQNNSD